MRFRIDTPRVASETIDGETIVIDLGTGTYYSLQGSGSLIWQEIARGARVEEVVETLGAIYESTRDQLADAVRAFVGTLKDEGLIVHSDEPEADKPVLRELPAERVRFSAPELQKYSDMQDIILLDPVHDVSAQGWPHVQEAGG